MNTAHFEQLLNRAESDEIDFKSDLYDFAGISDEEKARKRAKFIKDIVSMANTPREQSAFIVLGVRKHVDGTYDALGISKQIDGVELQHQISDWVYPHPQIHYEPVVYQGKDFGVIVIPADKTTGPFFSLVNVDNLIHTNQIYHRRDSQNSEADAYWQGKIWDWFRAAERSPKLLEDGNLAWNEFVRAVDGFDSQRQFILAISRYDNDRSIPIENLGLIEWSFVVDFDIDSDVSGLLFKCRDVIEQRRALHRIVKGDRPTLNITTGVYWYFARGMNGRESTIATGKFKDWQRQYDKDLGLQLEALATAASSRPTTVVILSEEPDFVNHFHTLVGKVNAAFGDSAEIVVISNQQDTFKSLESDFDAKLLSIPFHQLCYGLSTLGSSNEHTKLDKSILPSSSDAPITLGEKELLWLSEELDVVHQNIGLQPPPNITPGRDFLRGRENEISWYELGLQCDVHRDVTDKLIKEIRAVLERRRVRRINLYHAPGSGGTTVARRILWNFRNDYPCFILKRTKPAETADRLAHVYALTGLPLLLSLDGSDISERESNELYEVIASRQIPVVMFQVLRRFRAPKAGDEVVFNLDSNLSDGELGHFIHHLSRYVPEKREVLEKQTDSTNPKDRSPFYLGLITFEREFVSIEKYVHSHLQDLTPIQSQVIQYLALAQYYGQQGISAQAFASLLGVPLSRQVRLNKHIPESAFDLLVETESGKWRPAHQLIAEEILVQSLISINGDRRLWKQGLSDCAIAFADFCRGPLPQPTDDGMELARRVFVYRDNSELLGTELAGERGGNPLFAQLIGDIKLPEAKLRVLKHLTETFSDEAHFWAHLGRLYSLELKQFDKAVEAIDQGIKLQPADHVLHHMRGMGLRSSVYWHIEQKAELDVVVSRAKLASMSFEKARELDPVDEHGYISEAQMITRVLDYCGKVTDKPVVTVVASSDDPWLREAFQTAEDLLDHVRMSRVGERLSEHELRCRADLDVLYGKHQAALQVWDSLLSKRDSRGRLVVFAPPIRRQIVWTLLHSKNRLWSNLSKSQIERVVGLLEENLKEEPNDERNLRLWIQSARFQLNPPSLESVIEKVAYWKSNSDSLEAVYYLFVLHAIQAINGYPLSRDIAERTLEECRKYAKFRRDRTRSYEWLGNDSGLRQLVHQSSLGEWDRRQDFWQSTSSLRRIQGIITSIRGPESGWIELPGGLNAFFVPHGGSQRRAQISSRLNAFDASRSMNQAVSFYLGFSYDGLRAWSVEGL